MPTARENVALILAGTIAIFVLGTLLVVFALALMGTGLPDVWDSLFGLVIAVMSAIGGWLVGRNSTNGDSQSQDNSGG
jgi:hypothetical protein